jgi:hypothetical protein
MIISRRTSSAPDVQLDALGDEAQVLDLGFLMAQVADRMAMLSGSRPNSSVCPPASAQLRSSTTMPPSPAWYRLQPASNAPP